MSSEMEMVHIALPRSILAELLKGSQLKAKDLQCLNEESKQLVRELCLQSCMPKHCRHCSLHNRCAQTLFQIERQQIKAVALTGSENLN